MSELPKRTKEREKIAKYYKTIVSSMSDLIFILDLNHQYKEVFASSEKRLFVPSKEISGKHVKEILPERISSEYIKCAEKLLETHESQSYEYYYDFNGDRQWFLATIDLTKNQDEIIVVVQDITEQKNMEMKLRESKRRYRAVVDNTDDFIYMVNENYEIELINARWIERLGYDPRVTDEKCFEALAGLDYPCPDCKNETVFRGNKIRFIKKMKDGKIFQVYNAPIKGAEGRNLKISIARDITDEQKMEEERIRTQKFESIGLLAGGIAHDFNNALMTLMGNVEVLNMKPGLSPSDKNILKDMRKLIRKTTGLTNQLLTFAKGGEPVTKLVSIKKIIDDSVNMALKGSNCKSITRLPEELPMIKADSGQILQVFNNLLINADQAMEKGGIITILVKTINNPENSPLGKKTIRIDVIDRGIGIPEEIKPNLFVPYFTTKETGHGLGLATCYSIIKRHSGTITFDSEPGKGTTFSVYLPSSDVLDETRAKSSEPIAEEEVKPTRLLIMDDMKSVRKSIGMLLSRLGFDVDYAIEGSEVIQKYMVALENDEPYELLLLDLVIPNAIGGKETIKKLGEIDPHVRSIAMTGYSNDPILAHPEKFGFSGALQKPFSLTELKKKIKDVLNKKRGF